MSMDIVSHVWQKSQSHGSARTLLLTLAIHANDCCGVAWASDLTLRLEVNVSRQRVHELKNMLEDAGELVIVERPGTTNLYFVAAHGQPLGPQGEYQTTKRGQHALGCPLRDPALRRQCARQLAELAWGKVDGEPEEGSERSDPSVENSPEAGAGVSDPPDPRVLETSDGGCQGSLTQKTTHNKREKHGAPTAPMALTPAKRATKRCGWGGCSQLICPHEVNFCAAHAHCPFCRTGGADHRPDGVREENPRC
jgi:hypothetical protein